MDHSKRFQRIHEDLSKNIKKIKISIDKTLQKTSEKLREEQCLKTQLARFPIILLHFTSIEWLLYAGKDMTSFQRLKK